MSYRYPYVKKYRPGEMAEQKKREAEEAQRDKSGGISEAETERPDSDVSAASSLSPDWAGSPEVEVIQEAGAGNLVVASDSTSSGRQSPEPLLGPGPGTLHGFPYHARAWASMGDDMMERLEQVAVGLRLQQRVWHHSRAPVDACELHIAWDKMVHAVNCDGDLACLFDTGRVSSDSN